MQILTLAAAAILVMGTAITMAAYGFPQWLSWAVAIGLGTLLAGLSKKRK